MKYLEKALEMNEIDAEHRERTIREYEAAKERIKNLPLTLSDDADAMLLLLWLLPVWKRILCHPFRAVLS